MNRLPAASVMAFLLVACVSNEMKNSPKVSVVQGTQENTFKLADNCKSQDLPVEWRHPDSAIKLAEKSQHNVIQILSDSIPPNYLVRYWKCPDDIRNNLNKASP